MNRHSGTLEILPVICFPTVPYDALFSMCGVSSLIIWVFLLFPCTITFLFSKYHTDKGRKADLVGWLLLAVNMNDVLLLKGGPEKPPELRVLSNLQRGKVTLHLFLHRLLKQEGAIHHLFIFLFSSSSSFFPSLLCSTQTYSALPPERRK